MGLTIVEGARVANFVTLFNASGFKELMG